MIARLIIILSVISYRTEAILEIVSTDIDHVLYVISLDGRITAIDVREQGRQLWSVDTGSSLVNSSLSKIELNRNAKSFRLIPSLIGGLYEKSDDDESMQLLPFDAESLLNTSTQFHEELIITGGKEIDTLGLNSNTGEVIYSVFNENLDQTCSTSMLIIKRIRQTVRARSMINGYEKWIFSVSNHELMYLSTPSSTEFHDRTEHPVSFEYQLQTGLIFAFDDHDQLIWTSSIDSPLAAIWELKNGQLKERSLFKTKFSHRLAFMGEFNSTPYVIISPRVQRKLMEYARQTILTGSTDRRGPIISSRVKGNQQQLLAMKTDVSNNEQQTAVAIREDRSGYLELIDTYQTIFEEDKHVNHPSNWLLPTVCLGGLMMMLLIWYSKRKPAEFQRQESSVSQNSDYQLPEPIFQSRYIVEYEHIGFLGRGGFGVVFEAINKLDERRVAIKRVSLKKSSGKERALKEIRCLAILNHPNLISYYYAWHECPPNGWQDGVDKQLIDSNKDITMFSTSMRSTSCLPPIIDFSLERSLNSSQVQEKRNSSLFEHSCDSFEEEENSDVPITYFYFVMELCQSESLRDRLINRSISPSQVWSTIDQIIQGIEYIHSRQLIHRDLKPSNILFAFDNTIKIGDFGLVSAFGEDKLDQIGSDELGGTMLYMSPEQINRQSCNEKVDIYAIGIILFELLYPFSTQMERVQTLNNIRLQTPVFPFDFQSNCRLVQWLVAYSPHDRPKASELRQDHSYQTMLKTNDSTNVQFLY